MEHHSATAVCRHGCSCSTGCRKKRNKKKLFWLWFVLLAAIPVPVWIYDTMRTGDIVVANNFAIKENKKQNSFFNESQTQTWPLARHKTKNEMTAGKKNADQKDNTAQLSLVTAKYSSALPETKDNVVNSNDQLQNEPAVAIPAMATTAGKPSPEPDTATATRATTSVKKLVAARQNKLYTGIVAGPEISQVRQQGFTRTGVHAGLLAGYRLGRNITLESGAEFKKKYYYSDGKYFKMKTAAGAPAMTVISLDGGSSVLEVPLRLNYQVAHRKSASVFASAGISSTLLMRENNDYRLLVNGVPQTMVSHYKNASAQIAATADVSIGYEHTLGRISRIRVQPYVQVPLQGMGVGNMQVMSVGINVAIIKSFR